MPNLTHQQRVPFRFETLGPRVLLCADHGPFLFLPQAEFRALFEGGLEPQSDAGRRLEAAGFLQPAQELTPLLAKRCKNRYSFLPQGPVLHIAILTLRCNQVCSYCHASRRGLGASGFDMDRPTAEALLRAVMACPSPNPVIEFQGGEPLLAFDTMKYLVEEGIRQAPLHGKRLAFSLVSNLSAMDEEKLQFILDNNLQVCTSIDGPADLHNLHRRFHGGSHEAAVQWLRRIDEGYAAKGLSPDVYHVEALPTCTRDTLGRGRDLVDEYVRLGRKALFLRPLNPFGHAVDFGATYNAAEFLSFYREVFDYILELNAKGVEILERTAAIFLTKILGGNDPNFLDLRSPCGAGIGQIAYNYDGRVFTCDEGRMMAEMGEDLFCMGDLKRGDDYGRLLAHDSVRSLALASCIEGLPGCSDCAFAHYCGVCPVYSFKEQGTIFGLHSSSQRCRINRGILTLLFEVLERATPAELEIFRKWTTVRDRDIYFSHDGRLACSG